MGLEPHLLIVTEYDRAGQAGEGCIIGQNGEMIGLALADGCVKEGYQEDFCVMHDLTETPEPRLRQLPDWRYLLQEYYELYRFLPSGGSDRIRTHQRHVREAINRVLKANPVIRTQPRAQKPVTAHLKRALDEGRGDRMGSTIRALESVQDDLSWQYGYEKVPKGLVGNYAYAEVAGPSGPVVSEEIILGIVLFGPGCTYPAHAHRGITESYVCLSGAVSENHQGVYVPGSMIFNPPEHLHRITVGINEPALLIYAWMGARDDLLDQKMVFSRKRKDAAG